MWLEFEVGVISALFQKAIRRFSAPEEIMPRRRIPRTPPSGSFAAVAANAASGARGICHGKPSHPCPYCKRESGDAPFCYANKPRLTTCGDLPWDKSQPSRQVSTRSKCGGIANRGNESMAFKDSASTSVKSWSPNVWSAPLQAVFTAGAMIGVRLLCFGVADRDWVRMQAEAICERYSS